MGSPSIQHIFISLIEPDPGQPRKSHDPEALRRLAETIKSHGVEQPIRVSRIGDRFVIVHGERRWRACQIAGLESMPCIIEEPQAAMSDLRIRRLTENCAREDLAPLELALAIEEAIVEGGLTAGELARRTGLSEGHVSKLRLIAKASGEIQDAVKSRILSIAAAYELARAEAEPPTIAAAHADDKLSPAALARKIKRIRRTDNSQGRMPSRITAVLGKGRSITLTGKALCLESVIELAEQLLIRANKAKAQGISLVAFVRTLRDQSTA